MRDLCIPECREGLIPTQSGLHVKSSCGTGMYYSCKRAVTGLHTSHDLVEVSTYDSSIGVDVCIGTVHGGGANKSIEETEAWKLRNSGYSCPIKYIESFRGVLLPRSAEFFIYIRTCTLVQGRSSSRRGV